MPDSCQSLTISPMAFQSVLAAPDVGKIPDRRALHDVRVGRLIAEQLLRLLPGRPGARTDRRPVIEPRRDARDVRQHDGVVEAELQAVPEPAVERELDASGTSASLRRSGWCWPSSRSPDSRAPDPDSVAASEVAPAMALGASVGSCALERNARAEVDRC